jgi:hypothetical protein
MVTYTLVLTLMLKWSSVSTTVVPGYASEQLCIQEGEKWKANQPKPSIVEATFTCLKK